MNQYFTNNDNLKSDIRTLKYNYKEHNFIFESDLGVFSKNKVDIGTITLIESYFNYGRKNVKVLDVGCGYGVIGITLSKIMNCKLDMIDVNERALQLSKNNLIKNKVNANVFKSNCYEDIKDKYDVIITNPPIKAGKKIYMKIINDSFKYLKKDGELWFVMKNSHGVKTVYKNLQNIKNSQIIKKNKGFYVILTKNA